MVSGSLTYLLSKVPQPQPLQLSRNPLETQQKAPNPTPNHLLGAATFLPARFRGAISAVSFPFFIFYYYYYYYYFIIYSFSSFQKTLARRVSFLRFLQLNSVSCAKSKGQSLQIGSFLFPSYSFSILSVFFNEIIQRGNVARALIQLEMNSI